MDESHANTSGILSALSVSEAKGVCQIKSLIPWSEPSSSPHDKNSFHQISSIPQSAQQNQQERTKSINGCRLHLISIENDDNLESLVMVGGKGENSCTSTGTELCTEYQHRPRSQSMGLVVEPGTFQASRSHSRDSLGSYDSLADEYQTPSKSESTEESLVEVTCNKFKRLSTKGNESPKSPSPVSQNDEVKICSRSHPTYMYDKQVGRKYSIGSQLSSAKRHLSGQESPLSPLPIDLTCKRKKSDATSTSLNCLSIYGAGEALNGSQLGQTKVNFEKDYEDQSILKSVLVGIARKRSHTLSVCSRQHFKNSAQEAPCTGLSLRQRVTLAKRNLGPVMRRISEHLNGITQFLCLLPDFMKLTTSDQRTLISDSVHRLLMIYMAEGNQQFVVTPIRDEEDASAAAAAAAAAEGAFAVEEPTMQFTEAVLNYISKCQAMNISTREYSYMKIITLFHTGMHKC